MCKNLSISEKSIGFNIVIMNNTFKVCFIGGAQTGKTAFLLRHLNGNFQTDYIPTLGVEVHPLVFQTNGGSYTLNIWDTAGQKKFGGLRDGYYIAADAAVAFYSQDTISETNELVEDFKRVCPSVPIINVWSKSDLVSEMKFIKTNLKNHYSLIKQGNRTTYQISAKSNYNFEKPFLEILRALTKNPQLCFTEL